MKEGKRFTPDLDSIFNPRSVAVVGVSTRGAQLQFGGIDFVEALLQCDFQCNIYPINPKGGEIMGLKIYYWHFIMVFLGL